MKNKPVFVSAGLLKYDANGKIVMKTKAEYKKDPSPIVYKGKP